jgi:hypothetical protein
MANEKQSAGPETAPGQLTEDWEERARKAAREFGLPMPATEDIGSPEETEEQLRQAEQEGGE